MTAYDDQKSFGLLLKKMYPDIQNSDFEINDDGDGNGPEITYWSGRVGVKPTMQDLDKFWIECLRDIKYEEMKFIRDDEILNGTTGYTTQGLAPNNIKINSSRSDLDNMRNLAEFCRQAVVVFYNGKIDVPYDIRVETQTGWMATISSFTILNGDLGTAQGMAYLKGCKGLLNPGDIVYLADGVTEVATIAYILKENLESVNIKGFSNDFHLVNSEELDVLVFELQAYGLWLFQKKWEKDAEIQAANTEEAVALVNFWS